MRYHSELIIMRQSDMFGKASVGQDRPMMIASLNNVVTLDGVELPRILLDVLPLSPKHPVGDNFNEVHFIADVGRLHRELREINTDDEKFCEIKSSAKWYAKNVRETTMDRGVKKRNDLLRNQKSQAVRFDKGCRFLFYETDNKLR